MKKMIKWLISGGILFAAGLALVIIGTCFGGSSSGYREYWTDTDRTFTDKITAVRADLDCCNLTVGYYEGDSVLVTYPESSARTNLLQVQASTLVFTSDINDIASSRYTSNFPTAKIQIPSGWNVGLTIEADAGEITILSGEYGILNIELDAGTVNIGTATFTTAVIEVDAGSVTAENLTCASLNCSVDAGSVKLNMLTCSYIRVNVDAGSFKACLSGSRSDYAATVSVSLGSCNISSGGSGTNLIYINVDVGSAEISFTN